MLNTSRSAVNPYMDCTSLKRHSCSLSVATLHARTALCRRVTGDTHALCTDSGATDDMMPWKEYFTEYWDLENHRVYLGDGKPVPAVGIGTIRMMLDGHGVE